MRPPDAVDTRAANVDSINAPREPPGRFFVLRLRRRRHSTTGMFSSTNRTVVVVGAQWGDEGKGKLVDVLAERADWVVRYQGGANAGHTVDLGEALVRPPSDPERHPA